MLVVTSNWCVSDGTLGAAACRGVVDRFRTQLRRSILRGGFRRDGSYRPVDAVDLVFAGDTFDWLTSREWIGDVRPWDGGRRAASVWERVAAGAVRRAARLLATLAAWNRRGIDVPAADRRGRPTPAVRRNVPVRVAVLRGDRDRLLDRLPSAAATLSRAAALGGCWSHGGIEVRHGEECDPLCDGGGREPTLGESIAVDLFARFGGLLDSSATLRPLAAPLLSRLTSGRCVDAAPRLAGWLVASGRSGAVPAVLRQDLHDAWNRCVAQWQRAAHRLAVSGADGVDLVGPLAAALELGTANGSPGRGPIVGAWGLDAVFGPEAVRPVTAGRPSAAVGSTLEAAPPDLVILGHPSPDDSFTAECHRRVVCLGPASLHRRPPWYAAGVPADGSAAWSEPAADASPSAVVVRADIGAAADARLEWLPLAGGGERVDDRAEGGSTGGVWWSDAVREGQRFIDAA